MEHFSSRENRVVAYDLLPLQRLLQFVQLLLILRALLQKKLHLVIMLRFQFFVGTLQYIKLCTSCLVLPQVCSSRLCECARS